MSLGVEIIIATIIITASVDTVLSACLALFEVLYVH